MEKPMNNPTLALIHAHASCRIYKPDLLPVDLVERIISASQRTSTSSNMQTYSIVATTDPEIKEKLAQICSNQAHILAAPLFLTWCADLARLQKVCQMQGYVQNTEYLENFLIAAVDAALAAQTAALAAESLGLGICYIGSIRNNSREVIKILNLPALVFPISGMTIGWPGADLKLRPRLPLKTILHWEKYNASHDENALSEYDQIMLQTGIYNNRQVPISDKNPEIQNYGWLEHTARRVSQIIRPNLRKEIEDQGFGLK
jgi:FMN reductase (NADPH)